MIVAMMVQDSEDYIGLALQSVLHWADNIVIIDGGSRDRTLEILEAHQKIDSRIKIIKNEYLQDDLGADGKQRNVYLKYLIEHHLGEWCLVVDADEVVSDNAFLLEKHCKDMDAQGYNCADVYMEHFIYSLTQVDSTVQKHYCPKRLFKIQKGLHYPEVEHNILEVPNGKKQNCDLITLFHLGYIRGLFDVMKRYNKNMIKSNIHKKDFLNNWKNAHILGYYPTRKYTGPYPRPIREYFGVGPNV